jgi:hypothetical protein
MIYAGIGSRKTPEDILTLMSDIGRSMEDDGWTVRSGGADGADSAFTRYVNKKVVYIPWKGFNGVPNIATTYILPECIPQEVMDIAKQFHPAWHRCSRGAKRLHCRNVYQILGVDLKTPCDHVICWTPDGKASGGTGQAIRIADAYDIPVLNLHNPKLRKELHGNS